LCAQGKGWTPAGELAVGDLLATADGRWLSVEKLYNTGSLETVYNFRVADHHTYFVGGMHWGFNVWVHNAKYAPKGLLSDATKKLAERNIRNTGKTVLGPFNPAEVRFIDKAKVKDASYFDIGKAWDDLTLSQRWAANQHFLDKNADAGDQVFISIAKRKIRPGSYLAAEVKYLTKERGYKWVNQWSLVPGT
jgi:hypothetical protein